MSSRQSLRTKLRLLDIDPKILKRFEVLGLIKNLRI